MFYSHASKKWTKICWHPHWFLSRFDLDPFISKQLNPKLLFVFLRFVWTHTHQVHFKVSVYNFCKWAVAWCSLGSKSAAVATKHSVDRPVRTETTESVTDFFIFPRNPCPGGKENILVKTGLTGDQFSSKMVSFFNHYYTVIVRLYIITTKLGQKSYPVDL